MRAKNPKEIIEDTYNAEKNKVIERSLTGFVMPLDMKRDFDYVDPMRFSEDEPLIPDDEDSDKDKKRINNR